MKARDKGQLNEEQWNKIKKASGLPEEARNYIELSIGSYRAFQEEGPKVPPAKIKEKLRKLRNQARELLKGFEEALGHDDIYFALVPVGPNEWHPRNFEQRKELAEHHRTEKVRADLRELIDWLDQSERALPRRKPGPPAEVAQNMYLFVDSIDNALREYTNERLKRSDSHQKMMEEIFAIVDPEVGKRKKVGKVEKVTKAGMGRIDTAMRQVIDYGKRSDGKLLLPGSRHYRSGRR